MSRDYTDGWTYVTHGKGFRHPAFPPPGPTTDRTMTVQALQASYTKYLNIWRASSCRKELLQILEKKAPDEGWQITTAVCLASGEFSRDNVECARRSMQQFAAFMDTVEYMQKASGARIKVPVDVAFLTGLNIDVRNDHFSTSTRTFTPSAWTHDDGAHLMVWELFIDRSREALVQLFKADPTLLIGVRTGETHVASQFKVLHGEDETLAEKFTAARASYYFPKFEEEENIFLGLQVYWKEPVEEEDDAK
ncbi:uncharacterized protein LTR77_005191 [Saxophila tyrrhenica]|uniref:SRR1-like domain-containing protein n=1 Tax=Saxophila tyrrhenica TaxID=1690608 RepID=A0AAV9PEM7_9PEZI|nr:hypothetical protein LTR77_005191 [Saxophila tyrrhenica]